MSPRIWTFFIAATLSVRGVEGNGLEKIDFFEIKYLRGTVGVTSRDKINNGVVRIWTGLVRKLEDRVDYGVLRRFGHLMRIDDGRMVEG